MNSPTQDKVKMMRQTLSILLSITVGFVIYSILEQISGYLTIRGFEFRLWANLAYYLGYILVPWILLAPIAIYMAIRFPITPYNWSITVPKHLLFLFILSFIHVSGVGYYYHYLGDVHGAMEGYQPWQHIGHFLFGDSLFLYNAIIYSVFVGSFNLRNFYFLAQQKQLEATNLEHKLTESKLHALRMQVDPHFLFNTLNVISVLVMKQETHKASDMIEKLSAFFRQTLNGSDEQWVPLEKELNMLRQYLAIEQVRFGDRINIEQDYDADVMALSVPPMILQPIVENAIRHGLGEKQSAGLLTIQCKKLADRVLIKIADNGVGCDFNDLRSFKAGIGLTNVRQRLEQVYGERHIFSLAGKSNEGVTVTLELPITTTNSEQ